MPASAKGRFTLRMPAELAQHGGTFALLRTVAERQDIFE